MSVFLTPMFGIGILLLCAGLVGWEIGYSVGRQAVSRERPDQDRRDDGGRS